MRDTERLLIWFNLVGSIAAGHQHQSLWFPLAVTVFALNVVVQDRALRRRIGERAWPSEGFARFSFNTNLNFGLTHLLLGALLFALAGTMSGITAG